MFEAITQNLKNALSTIARGRLTEANIRDGIHLIRQALLEADVNYEVTQQFINRVTEQAVGETVLKSLNPSDQILGIVYQELLQMLGTADTSLRVKRDGVTVLMMCGLQGSGKTTTCGKLALRLKEQGVRAMLVAADLQRPAAIEQLKVIGAQIDVPVYSEPPESSNPVRVCRNAVDAAQKSGDIRVVILDTAGRLHIDDALMAELEMIDTKVGPDQAILVCDAMTGQDAVNSAKVFNEALELDGVILTKLDGDTRGGAALSIRAVTGVPIKFVGVGEGLDGLEEFHPDRMVSRILGGGDIVTLAEKAHRVMDEAEMLEQQQKMLEGRFTLVDFQKQMRQFKKLGPMRQIMKMIPGLGSLADMPEMDDPEKEMSRIDGIINSMTPRERENPDCIDRSRRNRIAFGSGCNPSDVNHLLRQFKEMSGVMQQMAGLGMRDRMKAVQQMASGGMFHPGANIRAEKQRSKRGPLDQEKARGKKKQQRKEARKARKKNRR